MKKIDTVVATFVACDGKTFSSEESCLEYEKKVQEEQEKERIRQEVMCKMNLVDVSENGYLYDVFVNRSSYEYDYIAYKFVYNSDFSLEEYVKVLGWRSYENSTFKTIINGELKYDVYLKSMPSLESGETYLIASYTDLSGDHRNPSTWWLYKLDDFKKYQIEEINKCYEKINSL